MLRKKRILGLFRLVELIFLGLLLSLVVSYLVRGPIVLQHFIIY